MHNVFRVIRWWVLDVFVDAHFFAQKRAKREGKKTTLNFANGAGASMSYVWRQRLCAYPVFMRSVGCPSSSFSSPSSSSPSSSSWFVLRSPTSMHDKNEKVNDVTPCTPQSNKWEWARMWSDSQQSGIRVVRKMRALNVVQLSITSTRVKSSRVCEFLLACNASCAAASS